MSLLSLREENLKETGDLVPISVCLDMARQ
jgi:hypothetical protein